MMLVILNPAAFSERTAESRPGPGPFTFTSRFFMPYSAATVPARSAATWAANGVLLREPRKPEPPAVAHDRALPCRSVIITIVVVERSMYVRDPVGDDAIRLLFSGLLSHILISTLSAAYRLRGRRGPLRVRALVFVRCPRIGKPLRWRIPR